MNALVSIDSILEPTVPLNPASLFGSGQIETIITAIEKDVRAEVYDIATDKGRERIKSVAYKIARSKTTLDDIGKEHVAAIKLQTAAIDKERKALRDRLDALKDEVRGPLTAWEEAEKDRVEGHERALVFIIESVRFDGEAPTVDAISQRIEGVNFHSLRDWQEFKDRADAAIAEALAKLSAMLVTAEQAERDAAELAELRRLKAEREEQDRANAAIKAAEVAAQQRAEAERQRAEQAKRDQEAAVARAIEQERQRAERDKAAAIEAERRRQEEDARRAAAQKAAEEYAERKRQENKRHRAKVHKEITLALSEILTDNADEATALIEAIAAGKIPYVSITY